MFKSIRWSLLFWYGLILAVVIAGFGATLYHDLDRAMRHRLEGQLHDLHREVHGALMSQRHPRGESFHMPESVANRFRGGDPDGPYYAVWDMRGVSVAQSDPRLSIPFPAAIVPPNSPPPSARSFTRPSREPGRRPPPAGGEDRRGRERAGFGGPPQRRVRGSLHELVGRGPRGLVVLVGRSDEENNRRLREFLGMLLAAGLGTLAVALAGGWFLAGRALAPILRMSEAASEISASNLSRRIDVARTESELGRLGTILNITFDRLQSAFLRQVQFTADASHELRTPLSIVISHAELALRKERAGREYRATIETCLKAARRMEAVVEGLLTLARADAGEVNLTRERLDLAVIVWDVVDLVTALAEPSGVTVSVDLEAAQVDGDAERLHELITNLATNAVLYNRPGGLVTIELRRRDAEVVLRVIDTGIGISEEHLPHLFERFYRVNSARSRETGGNGLGLAIARWVVDAHGGTIGVTSREGVGTTVEVTLPAAGKVAKGDSDVLSTDSSLARGEVL